MGWETTIATGIETALRTSGDAEIAAGNIFDREERAADEKPDPVSIYLEPLLSRSNPQSDPTIFKIYPFRVRLAFCEAARSTDDSEVDVVRTKMSQYHDALVTAIQACNPWSTQPISTAVYQVDFMRRLEPELPADIQASDADRGEDTHRIDQLWEFHVNES